MLTLGTALPHAIRGAGNELPWQAVASVSSALAAAAAMAVHALGDGPHLPAKAAKGGAQWGAVLAVSRIPAFRASALGYFGHMWELYAMWTITPFLVASVLSVDGAVTAVKVAWWTFTVIAVGAAGCVAGGALSRRYGSARVAGA